MIDLSSYPAIYTANFVRLDIPDYGITRFSDYYRTYSLTEEDDVAYNYDALGQLLEVTNSSTELRGTNSDITLVISGIPTENIGKVLDYRIKGSTIRIWRAFFDPNTDSLLSVEPNPRGRFSGVVNNFTISDELGEGSKTGSVSISLTCTSTIEILRTKISGRRTNPVDLKNTVSGDLAFDRIPALSNARLDFGAPTGDSKTGTS